MVVASIQDLLSQEKLQPGQSCFFGQQYRFLKGELNNAEFLESVNDKEMLFQDYPDLLRLRPHMANIFVSFAHYFIGFSELASGNRKTAKMHFKKAIDSGLIGEGHAVAVAIHKRIDDPDWLPWLPNRDREETTSESE